MTVNHLLLLLLFLLTSKTGLSSEISEFVQTGASLQLDIHTQQLPEFDLFSWMNEKSESIVRYKSYSKTVIPDDSYNNRMDFNNKTFSLTLKNMQKTDSGLYTAKISGSNHEDIVTYRVSVIDAVEAPVLTVNSVWSSSDSCIVNFTCRAHELMINSTYQNNSCSPEEVTSQENHTLILDCDEETIICHHSNPVSLKQDRINITQLCDDKNNFQSIQSGPPLLWIAAGLVAVCILIICVSIVLYCKYKKGHGSYKVSRSNLHLHQIDASRSDQILSICRSNDGPAPRDDVCSPEDQETDEPSGQIPSENLITENHRDKTTGTR